MEKKNILFTGKPGCGKTTLVERILGRLEGTATGFFTREIRENGVRAGFLIETLDGKRGVLARPAADPDGRGGAGVRAAGRGTRDERAPRVGRYAVDLPDIERVAVPSMVPKRPGEVVVIDEIGKMECLSPVFRDALLDALESKHPVVATAALRGTPFIEGIKARTDVVVILVTEENRDRLAGDTPFQRVRR